jgi:hypothetical protein
MVFKQDVVGFCEYSNESLSYLKAENCDQLSNWQLLTEDHGIDS